MTVEQSYREALRAAHREALLADPRVFLMGEDVARYGGTYAVSLGLVEEFGPDRVRDTPLSESAFVGAGIGAALAGMRPIVVHPRMDFMAQIGRRFLTREILHVPRGISVPFDDFLK